VLLKQSRAHLRSLPRDAPAKLTKGGGVLLKSELPTPEPALPAGVAALVSEMVGAAVERVAGAAAVRETFAAWKEAAAEETRPAEEEDGEFVLVRKSAAGP